MDDRTDEDFSQQPAIGEPGPRAGDGPRRAAPAARGLAWLAFLATLVIVYPVFLPTLSEINPWDEAAYINSGHMLVEGAWPSLAQNPASAALYGALYLIVGGSTLWMVYACALGRLALFALLWWGAYSVARRIDGLERPLVVAGLFALAPMALDMLRFPSDALFAGLAALALARGLDALAGGRARDLAVCSAWLGLATLARLDGLIVFPAAALVLLGARLRRPGLLRAALAVALPFAAVVGGAVALRFALTGDPATGVAGRTYENFESGQQLVFAGSGEGNPVIESRLEARRLFGTPEENRSSVLRAIQRNPSAYAERLTALARSLPREALHAYGIRFAVLLGLLALRGAAVLARRRQIAPLLLLAVWPAHLASAVPITLIREGHLQLPFIVVLSLAALGVETMLSDLRRGRGAALWAAALLAVMLYGVVDARIAVFYGALLLLAGAALCWALLRRVEGPAPSSAALLLILLCFGLVARGNYPAPRYPEFGRTAEAQAVTALAGLLPRGSPVASGAPGPVWAARMTYAGLASTDVPAGMSAERLLEWLAGQGVRAIYVDRSLSADLPALWGLIEPQIGAGLTRAFVAESGNLQILLLPDGAGEADPG